MLSSQRWFWSYSSDFSSNRYLQQHCILSLCSLFFMFSVSLFSSRKKKNNKIVGDTCHDFQNHGGKTERSVFSIKQRGKRISKVFSVLEDGKTMTLQADTLLLITDGGKDAQLFIKLEYMCLIGGSWKKKSRLFCKISCPLTTSNCSGFMSWFEIQSIYYIARKMWGTWRIKVKPKGMLNLAKTSLNIAPVMEHTADSSFYLTYEQLPK